MQRLLGTWLGWATDEYASVRTGDPDDAGRYAVPDNHLQIGLDTRWQHVARRNG